MAKHYRPLWIRQILWSFAVVVAQCCFSMNMSLIYFGKSCSAPPKIEKLANTHSGFLMALQMCLWWKKCIWIICCTTWFFFSNSECVLNKDLYTAHNSDVKLLFHCVSWLMWLAFYGWMYLLQEVSFRK